MNFFNIFIDCFDVFYLEHLSITINLMSFKVVSILERSNIFLKYLNLRPAILSPLVIKIDVPSFVMSTKTTPRRALYILLCYFASWNTLFSLGVCHVCFQINVLCAVWKTVCAVAWYFGRTDKFPEFYFRVWII